MKGTLPLVVHIAVLCLALSTLSLFELSGFQAGNPTGFVTFEPQDTILGCPTTINTSSTMTQNIAGSATCITFNADDIFLDCNGFLINVTSGFDVSATGRNNITVRNCRLAGATGIFFSGVRNSQAINNSINVSGTSGNILFSVNITIANNTLQGGSGANGLTFGSGAAPSNFSMIANNSIYGVDGGLSVPGFNNTIFNNTIIALPLGFGVSAGGRGNAYIRNTIHGGSGNAISSTTGSYNTYANNTLTFGGVSFTSNHNNTMIGNLLLSGGIGFTSSSDNLFIGNNITSSGIGVSGTGTDINNTFINNNFSTPNAIVLSTNSILWSFFNTTIRTNDTWINTAGSPGANFTNTTFDVAGSGSIRIVSQVRVPTSTLINLSILNISFNNAFLNATALPFLNQSAQITLRSLGFANPRPLVDLEGDGTFLNCTAPRCTEDSFASGTFVFNVTGFTAYSSEESPSECGTITSSTTLANNLTAADTCIVFGASNIFLDCAGYTITYANVSSGDGINATRKENITIRNCRVVQGNSSATTSDAISLALVNNSYVFNSFVNATGSASVGINLESALNNTVANNSAFAFNLSSVAIRLFPTGSAVDNNTLINNTAMGETGVLIYGGLNNTFINNTAWGTANGFQLIFGARFNTFINNTGESPAAGSGISIDTGSHNNTLIGNIFVANTGYAVFITDAQENRFTNTTLMTNSSWLRTDSALGNMLTNTTFNAVNGSIRVLPLAVVPSVAGVNLSNLNVTFNRAFLNATNLTFLNLSSQIALRSISFSDPQPLVDLEDDGTFAACSLSRCQELSFAGNVFVYNVSSFTSYSSQEGAAACGSISQDTNLTANVQSSGTCFTITASGVDLDCNGFLINYSTQSGGSAVLAADVANLTIRNCRIVQSNSSVSASSVAGIDFSNVNRSLIANVTIGTAAANAYGVDLRDTSRNITIEGARINTSGSSSHAVKNTVAYETTIRGSELGTSSTGNGIYVIIGSRHNFTNNNLTAEGAFAGGAFVSDGFNVNSIYTRNRVQATGSSASGFVFGGGDNGNIVTENTIVNATLSGIAMTTANYNTIANNSISALASTQAGINLAGGCSSNNITGNRVNATSPAGTPVAIKLNTLESGNLIANNTASSSGLYGIEITGTSNTFISNVANGTTSGIRVAGDRNNLTGNLGIRGITVESANNTLINNTGISTSSYAIYLGEENTVINSTGIGAPGIRLNGNRNIVINSTGNSSSTDGILVVGSNSTLINVVGKSSSGTGIGLLGSSDSVLINATGISSSGGGIVFNSDADRNNFTNVTAVSNSVGVSLGTGTNNTFRNITIRANGSWITTTAGSRENNFTAILFDAPGGSLFVSPAAFIPNGTDVTQSQLNVSFNFARLNSTAFPFLNRSSQIILRNIPFAIPQMLVDFNDDGAFEACSPAQCQNVSYSGGTFVFNVSSFTSYSTEEAPTIVSACTTISASGSYRLDQSVTATGTCINITAHNVVFDCDGFNVTFGTGGGSGSIGINATGTANTTIKKCGISTPPSLANDIRGILLHNTTRADVFFSTISADGDTGIIGLLVQSSSDSNVTSNNVTSAGGSGSAGLKVEGGASNRFTSNFVTSANAASTGIRITDSSSNFFIHNRVNVSSSATNFEWVVESVSATPVNNIAVNLTLVRNSTQVSIIAYNHSGIKRLDQGQVVVASNPPGNATLGLHINVTGTTGSSWVFLNISYNESALNFLNISESKLRLWKHNGTNWTNVSFYNPSQYGVDTSANQVFANITSFSTFTPASRSSCPYGPPITVTVVKVGTGTVTSSPSGISCGGDCSESYACGDDIVLTASGGTFLGWSGDCAFDPGTGPCTVFADLVGATTTRTVTATFTSPSAVCGNGVVEGGEACDNGGSNGACPAACSSSCTVNSCPPTGGGGSGDTDVPAPVEEPRALCEVSPGEASCAITDVREGDEIDLDVTHLDLLLKRLDITIGRLPDITTTTGGEACRCNSMDIIGTGEADGNLQPHSSKGGGSPKELGKIEKQDVKVPKWDPESQTWTEVTYAYRAGYAFEVHADVTGNPAECTEGQDIQSTLTKAGQVRHKTSRSEGGAFNEWTPGGKAGFNNNGEWGTDDYQLPDSSMQGDELATYKEYFGNVIHWYDSPGSFFASAASLPASLDYKFRSFVEDSDGEGSCECTFKVSIRVGAGGQVTGGGPDGKFLYDKVCS